MRLVNDDTVSVPLKWSISLQITVIIFPKGGQKPVFNIGEGRVG